MTPDIFPFHQCCTLLLFFDKCSDCLRINQPLPASSSSRGKQLQRRKFPYLRYFLSFPRTTPRFMMIVCLLLSFYLFIVFTFHLFLSQLPDFLSLYASQIVTTVCHRAHQKLHLSLKVYLKNFYVSKRLPHFQD